MRLRALLATTVIAATLLGAPSIARACSCIEQPASELIATADGGFIGSLIEKPAEATENGQFNTGTEVKWRFEVSEWIKGDLASDTFDVYSPQSGASCGFGLQPGVETAVFVYVDDAGRPTGGLCSTTDASSVRGYLRPLPLSEAPGRYFARGSPRPAYILDADALVVSASPERKDAPFGELETACGGSIIAEHRYKEVALTDVATYQELESLPFKRRTRQILCSEDWLLAVGGPKDDRRVYNIRTLETLTGSLSKPTRAALSGDRVIFAAKADETFAAGVRMLDLGTGTQTLIHEGRPATAGRSHRVRGIEVSPDGTRVAITSIAGDDADQVAEVFVYSPAGELLASSVVANNSGRSYWLDDTKLLFQSNSGRSQVLAPSDLSVITDLGPNLGWVRYLEGDRLLGIRGASVLAIPVTGGEVEVLNSFPAALRLVRLAEPVVMTTVGSATDVQIVTPISSPVLEALESSEAEPLPTIEEQRVENSAVATGQVRTDSRSVPGRPLGIGLVTLVIGASILAVRWIRQRS